MVHVWTLTDGKAGDRAQTEGLAARLAELYGWSWEPRQVAPRNPWAWFMPWGLCDPIENPLSPLSPLRPPFPDVVLATGRRTVSYARALQRVTQKRCFVAFLKDPRVSLSTFPFVWMPEHDSPKRMSYKGLMTTLTGAHVLSQSLLNERRQRTHAALDQLHYPRVAVLIGGPNAQYSYGGVEEARLMAALETLLEQGASLMVTCSRRTPPSLRSRIDALHHARVYVWDGVSSNPYVDFVAKADAFFVTADSANMLSEVLAAGRGVMLYLPHGKPGKFSLLYDGLIAAGLMREFVGDLEVFATSPVDSTPLIAAALEARYRSFLSSGFFD